jgi:hypothetical protein
MAKKTRYISHKQFIDAVLKHRTASDAARALGISRQAVSRRVSDYKAKGIKGLPDYERGLDVDSIQQLIDKKTGGK